MRIIAACPLVFFCVLALFSSTAAHAQNVNDFFNVFRGAIQQGMVQAAQSEWRRLPPPEVSCLDQGLRMQGASVDALVSRGVFPSDPRLAQLRSNCRSQIVQGPEPATAPQTSLYVVDGLALGGRVRVDSDAYRLYQCGPSEKFPGFTWCHKEETKKQNRTEITFSNSILHAQDGTAVYVNRYIEPAYFAPNEVQSEIDRLSTKFGENARTFPMPQREGLPNAIIALWGKIQLEPLGASEVSTVASGGSVKGLLVSFLGDLQRSAKAGVPVYRLTGGAGFLWVATFNKDGRGVLRFLTIDASQIASPVVAANKPLPQPPQLASPEISLETKRTSTVEKSAELQSYFKQPEVRAKLSKDAETDLTNLVVQTDILSQLASVRLTERGDYTDKLATADAALARIEKYKLQIEQVKHLGEDLKTLNAKIEQHGRSLFDAQTLSDIAELQRVGSALGASTVPVSEDQLGDTQAAVRAMLQKIDELALKAQQAQKEEEGKLKSLYAYYVSLKMCNDRLSGELNNAVEQFRKALAEHEKGLDKEYTNKIWSEVASAAGIVAPMANAEPIYQLRQECNNMVAAIPLLFPGLIKQDAPKKDF